jgi:hypothetical protein
VMWNIEEEEEEEEGVKDRISGSGIYYIEP